MKKSTMTFGRAMLIFIVAYVVFFFLFAAADTLFFSPDLSPGMFSFDNLAVVFLVSIGAVFVVGAVLYYIIISI